MADPIGRSARLPASFVVDFPAYDDSAGAPTGSLYSVALTPPAEDGAGYPGEAAFRDEAVAEYADDDTSGEPLNADGLRALAERFRDDWSAWRRAGYDLAYNGVVPWDGDAYADEVVVDYTAEDASTRVLGPPIDGWPEQLNHDVAAGGSGSGASCKYCKGTTGWVLKAPDAGIDGATTAADGTICPGKALCTLYKFGDDDCLTPCGSRTAYNLAADAVPGGKLLQAKAICGRAVVDWELC